MSALLVGGARLCPFCSPGSSYMGVPIRSTSSVILRNTKVKLAQSSTVVQIGGPNFLDRKFPSIASLSSQFEIMAKFCYLAVAISDQECGYPFAVQVVVIPPDGHSMSSVRQSKSSTIYSEEVLTAQRTLSKAYPFSRPTFFEVATSRCF